MLGFVFTLLKAKQCCDLNLPKCRLKTGQRMFSYTTEGQNCIMISFAILRKLGNTKILEIRLRNDLIFHPARFPLFLSGNIFNIPL